MGDRRVWMINVTTAVTLNIYATLGIANILAYGSSMI